jgi:hypothetical protein
MQMKRASPRLRDWLWQIGTGFRPSLGSCTLSIRRLTWLWLAPWTAMMMTELGSVGYASTLVEVASRSSPLARRTAPAADVLDGASPGWAARAEIEMTPS